MKYYQEITLIDGDRHLYDVWSDVYTQIHIALADINNKHGIDTIGVSFPNYRYEEKGDKVFAMLGNKLRVFAPSKEALDKLNLTKWLERLDDYVHIKSIKEVPKDKDIKYISVHRYRFKPVEVQAKSLAEKLNIGIDEAMATVAKRKPELKLPFIQMRSQTNKTNYPLQIFQQPSDNEVTGSFNVYGMNGMDGKVTVPHWTS